MASKSRELWLDNIRAIGCITVATQHLLESLVRCGVLTQNPFLEWMFYWTHVSAVQVFFFCGGVIYQKYNKGTGLQAHIKSVKNRFLNLMIPYLVFCSVIYLLKTVFSSIVNSPVEGSLLENIFLDPPNQMWFLMVFFLCYLITPVFRSRGQGLVILGIALLGRVVYTVLYMQDVYFLYLHLLGYWIFFVFGMVSVQRNWSLEGKVSYLGVLAIPLSIPISLAFPDGLRLGMVMTLLYLFLFILLSRKVIRRNRVFSQISSCMLYIYLLHTMCATVVRTVLLAAGIYWWPLHFAAGLAASISIPILVAHIARKLYWIDFVFSPTRALAAAKNRRKELQSL